MQGQCNHAFGHGLVGSAFDATAAKVTPVSNFVIKIRKTLVVSNIFAHHYNCRTGLRADVAIGIHADEDRATRLSATNVRHGGISLLEDDSCS